jgi:histidine triad (HIT) family protein
MCLFCKIANKEIESNIEMENEDFLAFHDINPKAPLHILVIPKQHVDDFNGVSAQTMADMTGFIQELVQKLGIDKSGYRLITNIGENGGQEIPHLHWHVLGGSKLKWEHLTDADPKDFF